VFGSERAGEIGGVFGQERAAAGRAGVPEREDSGEGEAGIRGWDCGCDCNTGVSIGRVLAFEEEEASGVMFWEACSTESKSAPADSRSIVARPSKPSSIGRARARHSSGAKVEHGYETSDEKYTERLTVAHLQETPVDWYDKPFVSSPLCPSKIHLDITTRSSGVNAMKV